MVMKIFMIMSTLVVVSFGQPQPQYSGNYQYGKLSGGYQGPQQAYLYSINSDHYLLRLLQDMEKYEGNEVNYLVNSKIKDTLYGCKSSSTYSTSTSTTTTAAPETDTETTPEMEWSSSSDSTSTTQSTTATYAPMSPKPNCEIVVGKNGYVSSNVAYYQYPNIKYHAPAVAYPAANYPQPQIYKRY